MSQIEYLVIIKEKDIKNYDITKFSYIEAKESNEYEDNKEDKVYLLLKKEAKKAKDKLKEYLFKKRNNIL